jgi:hypothetical protein
VAENFGCGTSRYRSLKRLRRLPDDNITHILPGQTVRTESRTDWAGNITRFLQGQIVRRESRIDSRFGLVATLVLEDLSSRYLP